MGKQARVKRERREAAGYVASLTRCEGTWLDQAPDAAEQARIKAADQELKQQRRLAHDLASDTAQAFIFSLELFRAPEFAPLHFDEWVVEKLLAESGEPPVSDDLNDPAFSEYLKGAIATIASSRLRRGMSEQARRFVPIFVEQGKLKEALAIDYNAYLTVMSETVTPLLVQMMVAGMAQWYEEHEEDE